MWSVNTRSRGRSFLDGVEGLDPRELAAAREGERECRQEVGVDQDGNQDGGRVCPEMAHQARERAEVLVAACVEARDGHAAVAEEGGNFAFAGDGDDLDVPAAACESGREIGEHKRGSAAEEVGDEEGETWHGANGN